MPSLDPLGAAFSHVPLLLSLVDESASHSGWSKWFRRALAVALSVVVIAVPVAMVFVTGWMVR
jgi:hypothetical protein